MVSVRIILFVLLTLFISIAGVLFALRFADGPVPPFQGGRLTSGPLVTDSEVDWIAATGGEIERQIDAPLLIELQLVEPVGSRQTGVMLYEGQLYVPCDLGFSWNRFKDRRRIILHLVHLFKRWHLNANRDGRVVLRINEKRYERQAVRVTDPKVDAALRAQLIAMVENWSTPEEYGSEVPDPPNDIWFFRMDPRP